MKQAQSSVEASLIISFMVLVFVMFIGAFTLRLKHAQDMQEIESLERMGQNIRSELLIADSVQNGYQRNFSLPSKVGGLPFNITLINSTQLGVSANHTELVLRTTGSKKLTSVHEIKLKNVSGQLCTGPEYLNTIEKSEDTIKMRCKVL
jgi:hypothetical protein